LWTGTNCLLSLISKFVFAVGCAGLITSSVYLALVMLAAWRFRGKARTPARESNPPVSVLKPVHGNETGLEANLRGFFEQYYPQFELLFCARREDDPGLAVARKLAAEFPNVHTKILWCGDAPYANAKVFSLERMMHESSHDLLVVSDSDVRVEKNYLRSVVRAFSDENTGLVTCLYRGVAIEGGLWARLEAVGMSIEMSSGVVVSEMFEPVAFALGPTMAERREAVERIGGFGRLGPYCSDDFLLGKWIAQDGWRCVISDNVIEHMVLNAGFIESVQHQVRWMKSTRASRPKGHLGAGLTYSVPYGVLACVGALGLHRPELGACLLAWSALNRMVQTWVVGTLVVKEKGLLAKSLLFVLRDAMGFCFWLASYGSHRILWRGELFELEHDGKMQKVQA